MKKHPKYNHITEITYEYISNMIDYILHHSPDITYEELSRSVLHHVPMATFTKINDVMFEVNYPDTIEYLRFKLPVSNEGSCDD